MRIAVDTNRYVDFANGDSDAIETIQSAHDIALPLIVLAELRAGFMHGKQSRSNERNLIRFLSSPRVRVLYPDDATTHHYGRLFVQLRNQGTPIPTNDLWTAALVVQHELILFARDKHFDHIRQIPRI